MLQNIYSFYCIFIDFSILLNVYYMFTNISPYNQPCPALPCPAFAVVAGARVLAARPYSSQNDLLEGGAL